MKKPLNPFLTDKDLEGKSRKIVKLRPNGSRYVASINNDPSMADQSFKDDCDANLVVERFLKTRDESLFPNKYNPEHMQDLSGLPTNLLDATLLVQDAHDNFMKLDAKVRERFKNDPIQLMNFISDDRNRGEAEQLGLVPKKIVPIPEESGEGKQSAPVSKNKKTVVVSSEPDEE